MPAAPVPVPRRFEGRSVVVTGAGTGFGAEIAVRAAQKGARAVGVHYRSSADGAPSSRMASTPRMVSADGRPTNPKDLLVAYALGIPYARSVEFLRTVTPQAGAR